MSMKLYFSSLLSFIISFSVTLFIATFLLKIPHKITNHSKLIDEYYFENFSTSVPLDFLLVFVYFQISLFAMNILRATTWLSKILVVITTTTFLTGGFCFYFRMNPLNSSFFSRWFHSVGYLSVLYDIILLTCTFLIYHYIQELI